MPSAASARPSNEWEIGRSSFTRSGLLEGPPAVERAGELQVGGEERALGLGLSGRPGDVDLPAPDRQPGRMMERLDGERLRVHPDRRGRRRPSGGDRAGWRGLPGRPRSRAACRPAPAATAAPERWNSCPRLTCLYSSRGPSVELGRVGAGRPAPSSGQRGEQSSAHHYHLHASRAVEAAPVAGEEVVPVGVVHRHRRDEALVGQVPPLEEDAEVPRLVLEAHLDVDQCIGRRARGRWRCRRSSRVGTISTPGRDPEARVVVVAQLGVDEVLGRAGQVVVVEVPDR